MAPSVQKHVRDRIPDFTRRAQDMDMRAIRQHATRTAEHAVHAACEARGDRLEAAGQIVRARRLDDQVDVIVLN